MTIEGMGFPVVSLLGWQAGFDTTTDYSNAQNQEGKPRPHPPGAGQAAGSWVVTGFQGVNRFGDMTTLGRGRL